MRKNREGFDRLGKGKLRQPSTVEDAIHALQQEVKRVQEAIATLRRMEGIRPAPRGSPKRRRIRLSAKARRKVMQARRSRLARTEESALNTLARVFSSL